MTPYALHLMAKTDMFQDPTCKQTSQCGETQACKDAKDKCATDAENAFLSTMQKNPASTTEAEKALNAYKERVKQCTNQDVPECQHSPDCDIAAVCQRVKDTIVKQWIRFIVVNQPTFTEVIRSFDGGKFVKSSAKVDTTKLLEYGGIGKASDFSSLTDREVYNKLCNFLALAEC